MPLKKIALIYGGFSEESLISNQSAENLFFEYQQYAQPSYELILVELDRNGFWLPHVDRPALPIDLNDFSYRLGQQKIKFDGVFFMVHGTPIEDGKLQGYFELLKIPYLGSNGSVSAFTFNKYLCSQFLTQHQISTPSSQLISARSPVDLSKIKISYPCFAKPNLGGSSLGAGKMNSPEQLKDHLERRVSRFGDFIVEEYMVGLEITCGIYRAEKKIIVLPPTEIISENDFFDYRAKYHGESEEITPARISSRLTEKIQKLTKKIFLTLNVDGFARVDFIIREEQIFFIEINTIPGFTKTSFLPQQLRAAKIDLGAFVENLLEDAISNSKNSNFSKTYLR